MESYSATIPPDPGGAPLPAPSGYFAEWCDACPNAASLPKNLSVLFEKPAVRAHVLKALRESVRDHLVGLSSIERLGYPKCAAWIRERVPDGKKLMSGTLGEILATDYVEQVTEYRVPLKRLRHQADRKIAMPGDDLVAIKDGQKPTLLKGEAKSRGKLSTSVLKEATTALVRHQGAPNPSTLAFMAGHVSEEDRELILDLLNDKIPYDVEHLIFTLSGNDPAEVLKEHCNPAGACKTPRRLVGVKVEDHPELIKQAFEALDAQDT